ncbi:MAG: hypothetical protein Q9213_001250 [Squamulea squamosa]
MLHRSNHPRYYVRLSAFDTSMALTSLYSTFTFQAIDHILNEECVAVLQLYSIFSTLFWCLQYLANVLLLAAIFTYIIPRSVLTRQATQGTRTNPPLLLHLLFCGLLILFWLVITALAVAIVVQQVQGSGPVSNLALVRSLGRVEFVFDLFYLFATLEVIGLLIWGITAAKRAESKASNNPKVCMSRTSIHPSPVERKKYAGT